LGTFDILNTNVNGAHAGMIYQGHAGPTWHTADNEEHNSTG